MTAAKALIDRALNSEPDNQHNHALLADYELASGNIAKARLISRRNLQRWPDNADMRVCYVYTLLRSRIVFFLHPLIWCELRGLKRDFPRRRHDILTLEGLWAIRLNHRWYARRVRKALAIDFPDSEVPLMLDRMIAKITDDTLLKENAATETLSRHETDAAAHHELAIALFERCRFASARRSARRALAIDPTRRGPLAIVRLSWIVFFPPFLISQLLLGLSGNMRKAGYGLCLRTCVWFGLLLVIMVYTPTIARAMSALTDTIGVGGFLLTVALAVNWPIIVIVMQWAHGGRYKPRNVALRDY